jgi:transcription elongation factor GreA
MSERQERLTARQKSELEAELAELEGPRRKAIVEAIAHARGFGDLSENFEYHAAKNEQGLLERRITILRSRLETSIGVDERAAAASGAVEVGSFVEIEDEDGETMQIEISGVGGAGAVSPDSPLGRALIGRKPGETVDVEAPRRSWRAKIVSIGRP